MGPAKILIVATSHEQLGDTGRKTGLWLEELAAPYYFFKEAGATLTLASPKGGPVPLDPKSESIIASTPTIRRFQKDPEGISVLTHSIPLNELSAGDFDGMFLLGGHGPMWDFPGNEALKQLLESFDRQNKPLGLVCHGVSALLFPGSDGGAPFVKGKQLTGYSNSEEQVVGLADTVPFLLESVLVSQGASYSKGPDFTSHTVTDGNIITGQNPASSLEVAKRMLALLKDLSKKIAATLN